MSRNSRTLGSRPSDRCLDFRPTEPHPRAANELELATPTPRPRLPCCHRKRKTRLQASVRLVPHPWLRLSPCSPNPLRPSDPVSRASRGNIFRQSTIQLSVVANTPCRSVCQPDSATHSSENAFAVSSCRRPTPEPFPHATHQGRRFPGSGYLSPMSPAELHASLTRRTQALQAATDTSALPPRLSFKHAFAERLSSSTRLSRRAGYSPERSNHVPLIDFCNCHDLRAHHRRPQTRPSCGKPRSDRSRRSASRMFPSQGLESTTNHPLSPHGDTAVPVDLPQPGLLEHPIVARRCHTSLGLRCAVTAAVAASFEPARLTTVTRR